MNVTDVVGNKLSECAGALQKCWDIYQTNYGRIEYMYSFANNRIANVVIRPSNMDKCIIEVLKEKICLQVDLLVNITGEVIER